MSRELKCYLKIKALYIFISFENKRKLFFLFLLDKGWKGFFFKWINNDGWIKNVHKKCPSFLYTFIIILGIRRTLVYRGEHHGVQSLLFSDFGFFVNREKEAGDKNASSGWTRGKAKGKEEICLPMELVTKKKGEKAGTLLSPTRGFTAVIFPVHIPAPLYWGVRLRSEHLPSPGFLPLSPRTPGPLEVSLFVQSCAQNIAAAGQPRQSLQRREKEREKKKQKMS